MGFVCDGVLEFGNVMGVVKLGRLSGKENEIVAIPRLLDLICIKNGIITIVSFIGWNKSVINFNLESI